MTNVQTPIKKYLIICPPRSGSTWLCNLLELNGLMKYQAPQYEALHFLKAWSDEDLVNKDFEELAEEAFKRSELEYEGYKIQSFKVLTSQLRNLGKRMEKLQGHAPNTEEMLSILCSKSTKTIILDRPNTDALCVSWINAMHTNKWNLQISDGIQSSRIDNIIIFHKFYKMFYDNILKAHARCTKFIKEGEEKTLELNYESMYADPEETLRKCFEFLNIEEPQEFKLKSPYLVQRTEKSMNILERYKRFKPKFLLGFLASAFEFLTGKSLQGIGVNKNI